MVNYYLGTITEVLDLDLYKIKLDIPGLSKEAEAYPKRGELDEPRVGDQVLVQDIDPIYHSFYLYSKLKDDSFIGFRSRGKMLQITEDEINITIFDPEEAYEENDGEMPSEIKAYVKITKDGDIDISNSDSDSGKVSINIKDEVGADIGGAFTITVKGDATINSPNVTIEGDSSVKIDSPNVTITGGILNTNGSVAPQGSGPFCALPVCPFTGSPHVGPKVAGT